MLERKEKPIRMPLSQAAIFCADTNHPLGSPSRLLTLSNIYLDPFHGIPVYTGTVYGVKTEHKMWIHRSWNKTHIFSGKHETFATGERLNISEHNVIVGIWNTSGEFISNLAGITLYIGMEFYGNKARRKEEEEADKTLHRITVPTFAFERH